MHITRATGQDEADRPLEVVFLTAWLGFPGDMAPSIRVCLLARAMVEAGARAHVPCMQPSERPPAADNRETRGAWHGVTFEYTCGTTVQHLSFLVRRVVKSRWLARTAGRRRGAVTMFGRLAISGNENKARRALLPPHDAHVRHAGERITRCQGR